MSHTTAPRPNDTWPAELSEEEFLQLRLRNGLYVQRLAPMLRVAVPYGTLSSEQLRMLAQIARRYDRGYGHLSTRQNMQFNWPELAQVPDILEDLASVRDARHPDQRQLHSQCHHGRICRRGSR